MSLQGSLDTFALPDVLALLSSTKKTGELRVSAPGFDGKLWLDAGQIVGGIAPRAARPVEAVFELLRLGDGDFTFDGAAEPRHDGAPATVEDVLTEATARLEEWREIERVVPSMTAIVKLLDEPPAGDIVLRGDQWRLVLAIGGARPAGDVAQALGEGELPAARRIKELVEAGLALVEPVPVAAPAPPAPPTTPKAAAAKPQAPEAQAEAAPAPEPALAGAPATAASSAAAPVAEDRRRAALAEAAGLHDVAPEAAAAPAAPEAAAAPAPAAEAVPAAEAEAPAADAEAAEGDSEIDRGLLLKFLSSVRS